ncbi:hypothetical protein SAMN02982929_01358 [Saccharopolyspora kobensis]|uniref:Uncharacterized protein n=1 Tax=Saccharopolyspora kobensis TaxID=146035 RepID=A0A1H5X0P6_9PSEU|nr:hypothetical protein [Saccharopolyspora kobensis]SEG04975.1 hypothetical protein SAMN02982929_01358 [Saccharopolyspora kobensis]SFD81285.1 hypothetical protein SAMN05216506_106335 [Saccharopolyspora kobensis]
MSRLESIARAFLRYLYEDHRFRPEVADFFDSAAAEAAAVQPSWAELADVLEALRERELIATSGEGRLGTPARAGLTGSGLICAGRHGGDITSWSRSQSVAVLDAPAEAAVPQARSATEEAPHRIDYSGLTRVAKVVLLALPTVHARYGDTVEIESTARRLCEATRQDRPDAGRVRTLAQRLRTDLATGSVANTLGVVLLDGLDEALDESGLA